MNSTKKTARIAGALYLVNGVTGFFSIIYVPSKLFVSGKRGGDRRQHPRFREAFRLGIASEVICAVEYIYLLWALYRLLSGVNKTHASLMVIFGVAFVSYYVHECGKRDRRPDALARADFLRCLINRNANPWPCCSSVCRRYGYDVGWIFGLWLFHFGFVCEVGFLPRFLGALLIAACFGYLAVSLTPLLLAELHEYREPISKHPVNVGRTRGYLVASDSGSKRPAIGSWSIE